MTINKIDKKIISQRIIKNTEENKEDLIIKTSLTEDHPRDEHLEGRTYKLKTPITEHAFYITINDIVLNKDTDYESRHPYELFINTKNMEQFQWIIGISRMVSAIFRKGGDLTFIIEELKSVYDPRGGYYKKGGIYIPSLVAEIGYTIEKHLTHIGLIKSKELDEQRKQFIQEKNKQLMDNLNTDSNSEFPASATLCKECSIKAVIIMDGCQTCLSCGFSKCG